MTLIFGYMNYQSMINMPKLFILLILINMPKTLTLLTLFLLPAITSAQGYVPLVGIPWFAAGSTPTFDEYINVMYWVAISLAALLAVLKIIIAGVKWMLTDIVTSKSEAKKDIWGALLGLLIIIGAALILGVINPNIGTSNFAFQQTAPDSTVNVTPTTPPIDSYAHICQGGCTPLQCTVWHWHLSCSGWCSSQGGYYETTVGGVFTANVCHVPTLALQTTACHNTLPGQYNCQAAINSCASGNYSTTTNGGQPSIHCIP